MLEYTTANLIGLYISQSYWSIQQPIILEYTTANQVHMFTLIMLIDILTLFHNFQLMIT